jgi:hypothetical protein
MIPPKSPISRCLSRGDFSREWIGERMGRLYDTFWLTRNNYWLPEGP